MEISNDANKKKIPLILALLAPFIMIAVVAALIYFPGLGKNPKYSFVYATGTDVYYGFRTYQVQNGHLVRIENQYPNNAYPPIKDSGGQAIFYLYDINTNSARELSFSEAQSIELDPARQSEDGFEVGQGTGGGDGIFFSGSRDNYNYYIRGHNRSRKLNLRLVGAPYSNFQFLGWTK